MVDIYVATDHNLQGAHLVNCEFTFEARCRIQTTIWRSVPEAEGQWALVAWRKCQERLALTGAPRCTMSLMPHRAGRARDPALRQRNSQVQALLPLMHPATFQ
jgi:hypothetical protein